MAMLHKNILNLMRKKGITQRQLARETNLTEAAISHYVNGDRTPRIDILERISQVLDSTLGEIASEFVNKRDDLKKVKELLSRNLDKMTKGEKLEIIGLLIN